MAPSTKNSERVKHVVMRERKCIRTFVVILDLAASGSLSSCRPNSWKAMQPASNHSKWSWVMLSKWNTLEWLNSGDNVPVTVLVCVSSFSLNGLYLMYKPLLNLASWTVALRTVTCMKKASKNNVKHHLGLGFATEEEAKREREKDGSKIEVSHISWAGNTKLLATTRATWLRNEILRNHLQHPCGIKLAKTNPAKYGAVEIIPKIGSRRFHVMAQGCQFNFTRN